MKNYLLTLLLLTLVYSCKKNDPDPESPVITGTLKGKVTHYDQFGVPVADQSGVAIMAVNYGWTTTTDQDGNYAFNDVSSGTYTLTFKKPGCGDAILQDIRYKFTDTSHYNVAIADIPTFSISNAYVKDTTWFSGSLKGIYYNAGTVPAHAKATLVAIVGKNPSISLGDPLSYANVTPASLVTTVDYARFLSYSFLSQSLKFGDSSTIYVKIYPVAATGASYIDNQLNRPIYKAFGAPFPATFTLVMPKQP